MQAINTPLIYINIAQTTESISAVWLLHVLNYYLLESLSQRCADSNAACTSYFVTLSITVDS